MLTQISICCLFWTYIKHKLGIKCNTVKILLQVFIGISKRDRFFLFVLIIMSVSPNLFSAKCVLGLWFKDYFKVKSCYNQPGYHPNQLSPPASLLEIFKHLTLSRFQQREKKRKMFKCLEIKRFIMATAPVD